MSKMTKYQLEHFERKVDRRFDPLIKEQELLVKQYRTEATKRIVGKLAKKMGADKVLDAFKKAEENLNKARQDARTFFVKKAKDEKKNINSYQFDREEKLSVWTGHLLITIVGQRYMPQKKVMTMWRIALVVSRR